MASDKRRNVVAAMNAGSYVTRCPRCGFVPLYLAGAYRQRVAQRPELAGAIAGGLIGILGGFVLTAGAGASAPVVAVSSVAVSALAAAVGYWHFAEQKRAAQTHPDYPNHEWATGGKVIPRDKIHEPIWIHHDGSYSHDGDWPTVTIPAGTEERAANLGNSGTSLTQKLAIPSVKGKNASFREELPCGGTLTVSAGGWSVEYYFPGPDRRYNGKCLSIKGDDVPKYIEAFQQNWQEHERLKTEIPEGGEYSTRGALSMMIYVGGYCDGVCISLDSLRVKSETELAKVIGSYQYALSRGPQLREVMKGL
jgi:hypothetical protein